MNKQNVAHHWNGILSGHKKEWNTDTHYKIEPWKHYAKWEKSITKDHI